MEAISLKKVTAIVSICTLGAFLVNAKENDISQVVEKTAPLAEKVVSQVGKFEELIKLFDKDNNGLLSQSELTKSGKELLIKSFSDIDTNADLGVSLEEFNQFLSIAEK